MKNFEYCPVCGEKIYYLEISVTDLETTDKAVRRELKHHKCTKPKRMCLNCVHFLFHGVRCECQERLNNVLKAAQGNNIEITEELKDAIKSIDNYTNSCIYHKNVHDTEHDKLYYKSNELRRC